MLVILLNEIAIVPPTRPSDQFISSSFNVEYIVPY